MDTEVASEAPMEQPVTQDLENLSTSDVPTKLNMDIPEISESEKEIETISNLVTNTSLDSSQPVEVNLSVENNIKCPETNDAHIEKESVDPNEDKCMPNESEKIQERVEAVNAGKDLDTEDAENLKKGAEDKPKDAAQLVEREESLAEKASIEYSLQKESEDLISDKEQVNTNENLGKTELKSDELIKDATFSSDSGLELNSSNDDNTPGNPVLENDSSTPVLSADITDTTNVANTENVQNVPEVISKDSEVDTPVKPIECELGEDTVETLHEISSGENQENKDHSESKENDKEVSISQCTEQMEVEVIIDDKKGESSEIENKTIEQVNAEDKDNKVENVENKESEQPDLDNRENEDVIMESELIDTQTKTQETEDVIMESKQIDTQTEMQETEDVIMESKQIDTQTETQEIEDVIMESKQMNTQTETQETEDVIMESKQMNTQTGTQETEDVIMESKQMNTQTETQETEAVIMESKQIDTQTETQETEAVIMESKQIDTQTETQETEDVIMESKEIDAQETEQMDEENAIEIVDHKEREEGDVGNKDNDKEESTHTEAEKGPSGKSSPSDKTIENCNHSMSANEEPDTEDISMEQIDCDKSIANADVDEQEDDDDICVLNDIDPIGISQDAETDATKDDSVDFDNSMNKDPDEKEIEDLDLGKGADEELCIIPDTERVISQEEKDAATAKREAERDSLKTKEHAIVTSETGGVGDKETEVDKSKESEGMDNEVTSSVGADVNSVAAEGEKGKEDAASAKYVISECTEGVRTCGQCYLVRTAKYQTSCGDKCSYICDDNCLKAFKTDHPNCCMKENKEVRIKSVGLLSDNMISKVSFVRKCQECSTEVSPEDYSLSWETMDFCNEDCLSKYQMSIGSKCATCQVDVRVNCLGKYCVRFGYDIRQFCSSTCLEDFKKGLKVCVYCQKDISGSSEGFLAPVGDKGQFKDFCSHKCMEKYDIMSNPRPQNFQIGICSVCTLEKSIAIEFEHNAKLNKFCSGVCCVAYKFVNNITPGQCDMCKKYYDNKILEMHTMFYDGQQNSFCGKSCQNIYITAHRTIVACSWCKVKKYNFDMIKKTCSTGQVLMMCSVNCLSLFQVSINAVSSKKINCDNCRKNMQAMYHLTMSDATIRNFCSYNCVMNFQNQFSKFPFRFGEGGSDKPVPTGAPKRNSTIKHIMQNNVASTTSPPTSSSNLVISNVQSLASSNGPVTRSTRGFTKTSSPGPQPTKTQIIKQVIVKNKPLPLVANKFTMVKPTHHTKGINCRVQMVEKEVQTEEIKEKTVLIPIPVPIYVPAPMTMYTTPFPMPVPFPIPVPIPIFIPTTRNSANGIMKEIKKIQVKIPTDPFEAELLMMAEMVAGEKKVENTDSESEEDDNGAGDGAAADGGFSPEAVDTSNAFGEDMLQMALKMATELDEPAVDLEGALAASTITATQGSDNTGSEEATEDPQPMHAHHMMERQSMRGRKRSVRQTRQASNKRRRMSQHEMPMMQPPVPAPPPEPIEKPDANMCLKYTFGVNAWKQWVTTKNAELEKSSRRCKLFKNEILQLNSDELNYSLCLFVKEVRKPNGTEYAPDTIYYLCLGIQQYLFESGRIDNIFTDPYYEKFTECLDEVARKFSVLYNDSHYIVTRVEEEHLWESKQLGAHSPHVLLSTLMFFNTKHFNLTTVEEHMQLSFSHIMKHWKRNPNSPGAAKVPGSRNVLLRFYPPQTTLEANTRKKKVYEQQENEENPLRCPVKLYEFYLSKCPESVKTRNDVFYLLPERSCVPDSPVWYSTMALGKEALEKMLHRVKMVKEINVALLTS